MANTKDYGERDFKRISRPQYAAIVFLAIAFLGYAPCVVAVESVPRLLGTVVAMGKASMKTGELDRWISIDEKTHPVMNGTAFKTEEGTTSISMKDGTVIQMGKRTDLLVNGYVGDYSMRLQLGTIAFKLYDGIGLSVTTPSTSVVVQRVSGAIEKTSHSLKDEISGIITHDGKDTQVICQRGKFSVMRAAAETLILTEGNQVVVASSAEGLAPTGGASTPGLGASGSNGIVKVYENPAKVPELLNQLNTGGLEVVSENIP
jgi:hypothetical protein